MFTSEYFVPVFDAAIPVRLAARSFIIPVPKDSGEFLVYPHDIEGQPDKKAGTPVLRKNGEPKGTGILFFNHTDGAVQTARDDGQEMIIVNGLTPKQGAQLAAYYDEVIPVPEKASNGSILEVLRFAHQNLGLEDFFNGDRSKIPGFEIEKCHPDSADCGLFIRRSDEERFALLGIGSGTYPGPASSPQRFDGDVVVLKNAKHAWMVQTDAFLTTYRHPNDSEIKKEELPAFALSDAAPISRIAQRKFVP